MTRLLASIGLIAALSACASTPDSIVPVSMGNAFASMSCPSARSMIADERDTLSMLSVQQNNAVAGDAIGVFLIGVPVSSLSGGDKEGAIAATKGKILALEARLKTC